NIISSVGNASLQIGFAGGVEDPATGLVLFGLRDYDPSTGHWVEPDPALYIGNRYQYAGGDPVNEVDPTGLCSLFAILLDSFAFAIGHIAEKIIERADWLAADASNGLGTSRFPVFSAQVVEDFEAEALSGKLLGRAASLAGPLVTLVTELKDDPNQVGRATFA